MHRLGHYALVLSAVSCFIACGGSSPSAPSPAPAPTVTVTSVSISGANSIKDGGTSQLTATAHKSDQTTETVTSQASWQSSNTAVATVSSAGVVRAVAPGTTTISASYSGHGGQLVVTVTAVDNIQIVTITVTRFVIDGTCDDNNIFEDSKDGEFELTFEVERSGAGRSGIMYRKGTYTAGSHSVSGVGTTFSRNVSRGEDFSLWFTATETDGLLGADPRMNGRNSGRDFTYSGGSWSSTRSISLGNSSCGVSIYWTLTSREQEQ